MKTLIEMLNAQLPISPPVDATTRAEIVAGIVGAVQEWLGQDEMRPIMYRDMSYDLAWQVQERLQREAGKGLSDVAAS